MQETKLSENGTISLKGYDSFYKNKIIGPNENAHGGVAILASEKYAKHEIKLNTNLQAVAISIKLNKKITICSFYHPPGEGVNFSQRELEDLINQLPKPFMILGDFNAHNNLWYGDETDKRGSIIENILTVRDMHFLDKNKDTHVYERNGSIKSSHIDLSLCSTSLLMDYEWGTYDQLLDSDHYPVWLRTGQGRRPVSFPKWVISKANWPQFTEKATPIMRVSEFDSSQEANMYGKSFILDAAKESIPKTSGNETFYRSPWWNKECSKFKRSRAHDWRKFKNKSISKAEWNKSRAKTRQIFNWNKRQSWLKYMESINAKTSPKDVWRKITVLSNKYKSNAVTALKVGARIIDDPKEIADTIGESLAETSSLANCSDKFLRYKEINEKRINFSTKNVFKYNAAISMEEFDSALDECGNTAEGPDEIHNTMLKNLSELGKTYILDLLNYIFKGGVLPDDWKLAHIIPILKKDKDPLDPKSYRPISLLSCLSKLLGRILNKRLVLVMDINNCLHKSQNGFRKGRNTTFNLLQLENEIHDAFLENKLLVSIFFDLKNAYDKVWDYLVLKELYDFGFRGELPIYIANFLKNRKFQVRVGNKVSKVFEQEMGVPQGGILSVTLFVIAMNTIVRRIDGRITYAIYADDLRVSYLASTISTAQRVLNNLLKNFLLWMDETGFTFSPTKTKAVIFRRGKRWANLINSDLKLVLGDGEIEVVTAIKLLGLIFDEKLTWELFIAYLKRKCLLSINAMKLLVKYSKCSDSQFLLNIYRILVRSKLDYGCEAYGTAGSSYLERLDPVHHAALRLCTGAYRTSNKESLYVVANEPSLENRRLLLNLIHFFRSQRVPKEKKILSWEKTGKDSVYVKKSNVRFKPQSYGFKTRKAILALKIEKPIISLIRNYEIPPWEIHKINICFYLTKFLKSETTEEVFRQEFLSHKHSVNIDIFTDGSKKQEKVGSGVLIKEGESIKRMPFRIQDNSSVFIAELFAIRSAVFTVKRLKNTSCCIYTDSRSSLQAIGKFYSNHPLVQIIQEDIEKCRENNNLITLCWVPGHVGIEGNNGADELAKEALQLQSITFKEISASDFKLSLKQKVYEKWQDEWNVLVNAVKTPLTEIISTVNKSKHFSNLTRFECMKFNRLRIGHTKFAKQFLVLNEEPPFCFVCEVPLTVKHVLIECGNFFHERNRLFGPGDLGIKDLLGTDDIGSIKKVLQFFKDIDLYYDI